MMGRVDESFVIGRARERDRLRVGARNRSPFGRLERGDDGQGMSTGSITWMPPLDASMSALTTLALSTMTLPPSALSLSSLPLTVLAVGRPATSLAMALAGTTW